MFEDFRHLLRVTRILASCLDLEEQLPHIMDAAMTLTGADLALLLLRDGHGDFQVRAERSSRPVSEHARRYSHSIVNRVIETGKPVFVLNTDLDTLLADTATVKDLRLRTVMCTPLILRVDLGGVLYVHSSTPLHAFDAHKREIFMALSEHAAIAFENARLLAASISDPLTGLYNHAHFLRRLEEEHERFRRYKRSFGMVLGDIDRFKDVNDKFGHPTGDVVLRAVGSCLRTCVRSVDVAARYGGDEFALLLPETGASDNPEPVFSVAERVREAVANLVIPNTPGVTISCGIATSAVGEIAAADMLERADRALYAAKRAGRNKVCSAEA